MAAERMPIACVHCAKAKAKCDKKVDMPSTMNHFLYSPPMYHLPVIISLVLSFSSLARLWTCWRSISFKEFFPPFFLFSLFLVFFFFSFPFFAFGKTRELSLMPAFFRCHAQDVLPSRYTASPGQREDQPVWLIGDITPRGLGRKVEEPLRRSTYQTSLLRGSIILWPGPKEIWISLAF